MNNALATLQLLAVLIMLAVVAWLANKLFGKGVTEGAVWLKEKTPFGIPARAIDRGLTAATGREETLGGWLNEVFDPNARAVADLTKPLPSTAPDVVDTELRRFGPLAKTPGQLLGFE